MCRHARPHSEAGLARIDDDDEAPNGFPTTTTPRLFVYSAATIATIEVCDPNSNGKSAADGGRAVAADKLPPSMH